MFFLVGMLIFVISAIAVTYKVLVGYVQASLFVRLSLLVFLTLSWFAPLWLRGFRHLPVAFNGTFYDIAYKLGYFLMGFVLILFMLLFVRDILWHILYFVIKIPSLNPDNVRTIQILNVMTVLLSFIISLYGVYEAHQKPSAIEFNIVDSRLKKEAKIVVASDFHINQSTPDWHIQKIISAINEQNPDYILLVGDIIDDDPEYGLEKFQQLSALNAKKIYISLGNHEYYHKPYIWAIKFADLGFEVLHNRGVSLSDLGLYIAGVPDVGTATVLYDAAFDASTDEYKILMSHSPSDFKKMDKTKPDLQVSGHTHGGQIFPFQYVTKKANDYLSGMYEEDGTKLFVSKGAGYWGPPMRIMAEPDIGVINLRPSNQ